jgi:hypothetical protein
LLLCRPCSSRGCHGCLAREPSECMLLCANDEFLDAIQIGCRAGFLLVVCSWDRGQGKEPGGRELCRIVHLQVLFKLWPTSFFLHITSEYNVATRDFRD